jgi:hypothetical protein
MSGATPINRNMRIREGPAIDPQAACQEEFALSLRKATIKPLLRPGFPADLTGRRAEPAGRRARRGGAGIAAIFGHLATVLAGLARGLRLTKSRREAQPGICERRNLKMYVNTYGYTQSARAATALAPSAALAGSWAFDSARAVIRSR